MKVPKEQRENLEWRKELIWKCKEDTELRAKVVELYQRDPIFAFNAFFWTYDPRKRPLHHQPFVTYDYEDELILEIVAGINEKRDIVIDKSRDMGITWVALETLQWFWTRRLGGFDFLVGSRIEDYVDRRGDPRTHFERLRYNLRKLPWWLRPRGFDWKKHDNFMKLVNPETGATITGESNNANFSTQGRYAAVFFDEFAKWENTDTKAWMAAGDATPCRIAGSTPNGAGGQFYNLVFGGETGIRRLRYHWSRHPEKQIGLSCVWPPLGLDDGLPQERLTSPWYEKETLRRTPLEVAQELDIDYVGAGNPVFDGKAMESLRIYLGMKEEVGRYVRLDLDKLKGELSGIPFDPSGFLLEYSPRKPDHRYVLGVDVVEGVADGDFAVVIVLDRITKDVAAVYWSRIDEVMLSRAVKVISDWYSEKPDGPDAPWVGVETNGPGLATFDLCVTLGMTNLFMMVRYDVTSGGTNFKKGWRTDQNSRNELVAGIREHLIGRDGKLNSQRLVHELMSFVRSRSGRPEAKAGTHDDMVMAFGIALQIDQLCPIDIDLTKKARKELQFDGVSQLLSKAFTPSTEPLPTIEQLCMADAVKRRQEYESYADDLNLWNEIEGDEVTDWD